MQIFLNIPTYGTKVFDIESSSTIKELHDMIMDRFHIPKKAYYITHGSKILAPETKQLSEFNVDKHSTIQLNYRFGCIDDKSMQVFLRNSGYRTIVITVKSYTTVEDIEDKVVEEFGIPRKSFYLVSGGKRLGPATKEISEFNIENHSTIDINIRSIGVCDRCSKN